MMTRTRQKDAPALAPELATMLGEELLAGNEIASIHVGDRRPGQLRIVLRDPFRVQHPDFARVRHRCFRTGPSEHEEYASADDLHVLVSGPAPVEEQGAGAGHTPVGEEQGRVQ